MKPQGWTVVEGKVIREETGLAKPGTFKKGADPRRNKGGIDAKTRNARRRLAKMDNCALETLQAFFDSGDAELMTEALRFWGKYRLPVPIEKPASVDEGLKGVAGALSPEVAAKLAAMEVQ